MGARRNPVVPVGDINIREGLLIEMRTGSNSKDLKMLNRLLVRDIIRHQGPIARFEIARETGLTPSTVTVIVAELLDSGVIKEVGHGESSGGRRPVLLELNPTAAHVFAVRLQRGEVVTALFDLASNILSEAHREMDTAVPEDVVEAIGTSFEALAKEAGINPSSVLWCGVASPGLVDAHRGVVERTSNLGWFKVPLSAMLSQRLGGIPVHVENISNAAALAEKEYGQGRGHRHLIYINLSVGIGAGVIADGEIFGGVRGYAGEIGHMTLLGQDGPLCGCGRRGCVEAICGVRAVLRKAKDSIPGDVLSQYGLVPERLTISQLATSPLGDHAEVQNLIDETGWSIGVLAANLVNLLNPEVIIFGGELVALGEPLLQVVRDEVKNRTLEELGGSVEIKISNMRGTAPLIGAYALALERIFTLDEWDGHGTYVVSRPATVRKSVV